MRLIDADKLIDIIKNKFDASSVFFPGQFIQVIEDTLIEVEFRDSKVNEVHNETNN